MPNYSQLASRAAALLSKFGAPAVLERTVAGEYDATIAAPEEGATEIYNTIAVRDAYRNSEVDGTSVLSTDVKLLISATVATPPAVNDVIVFDGDRYAVVAVTPLKPGSVVLLYEVQARGA